MAIATPESYADMIDRAKAGGYAIPAINVRFAISLRYATELTISSKLLRLASEIRE